MMNKIQIWKLEFGKSNKIIMFQQQLLNKLAQDSMYVLRLEFYADLQHITK